MLAQKYFNFGKSKVQSHQVSLQFNYVYMKKVAANYCVLKHEIYGARCSLEARHLVPS